MLNLNYNIIGCKSNTIAPILANDFNYFLIGGGGGGAAGNGGQGGRGGEGGKVVTGSFSFPHLATATITVGGGGVSGTAIGATGDNGVTSSLSLQSSLLAFASGGLANFNTGSAQNYNQVGLDYDYFNSAIWAGDGQKGGDTPSGLNGLGGGANQNNNFPWTSNPSPSGMPGLNFTGGGAGGFRWDSFNGGGNLNGAPGLVVLSFSDPRNIYEYVGDWDLFYYLNGRKYFYWLRIPTVGTTSTGTFRFLGQRDI